MGTIEEKSVMFEGSKITCLSTGSANPGDWVVLLHGKRFTAADWQKSGLLDALSQSGYKVIALNLPGYGSSESLQKERSFPDFLGELLSELNIQEFHLVGPSFSGEIALQFALKHSNRLKSLTLIANINVNLYEQQLASLLTKTLIVWGTQDNIASYDSALILQAKLPNNTLCTFENLGHTCYFDDMPTFREALLTHLK